MLPNLTPSEERTRLMKALAHAQAAMVQADGLARTAHHYLAMAARALDAVISHEPQLLPGSQGTGSPYALRAACNCFPDDQREAGSLQPVSPHPFCIRS